MNNDTILTPKQFSKLTALLASKTVTSDIPGYSEYLKAALAEAHFHLGSLYLLNLRGAVEVKESTRREEQIVQAQTLARCLAAGLPVGAKSGEWLRQIGRRQDVFRALQQIANNAHAACP